jgi:hypothetical protein
MFLRKHAGKMLLIAICLFAVVMITAYPAYTIPAFARKYSMSCTTCHAPVPRLKAYGDEFAGNGFEMEDQDAPRYTMKTGDDNLSLMRSFPLAARLDGFVKHQSETGKESDFSVPYNLKLLSGGTLGTNLAYYFYFYMSERGEVAGVEDAYIMFNNLLSRDLDVYLGQFQVSDPLFKRELRLTYEDYQIYKYTYGDTRINLAYDRGVMVTYGIEDGPDVILEVINGNGLSEADSDHVFDDDKYKSVAGRISYDLSENLRLGGFAYYGKEATLSEPGDSVAGSATNEVTYFGPDMTVSLDKLELNFQYMYRSDDNPNFVTAVPSEKVKTYGGFVEAIYWPDGDRSRWYLAGLYNCIDTDFGAATNNETMYETITGHAGYLLRTNLRLVFENTYDIKNEENRVLVGFVSGF